LRVVSLLLLLQFDRQASKLLAVHYEYFLFLLN
jgi:hypothetical protein